MSDVAKSSHAPEPSPELRARFRDGEPAAIEELAEAFYDDLARFATAVLGDGEVAMDAIQETFLRLLERHRLYSPERAFRPWLFAVCRNCCLSLARQRAAQSARVVDLEPTELDVRSLAAEVPPALEALLRAERESEALAALASLPEATRTIIVLHLFENLTFREVSAIVGRPLNTVATVYYRALADLRRQLDASEADNPCRRSSHAS